MSSGTSTARPTAPSTDATAALSAAVRESSAAYPIAPSRTATQWLGMTLTFLQSGTYALSFSSVSPATRLRTIVPGFRTVPSSTNTAGTCAGLTARTTMSVLEATSAAVGNISTPYVPAMRLRVDSLGAHPITSSFEKTPLARRPPMRASPIFPAPMNPMRAAMASVSPGHSKSMREWPQPTRKTRPTI